MVNTKKESAKKSKERVWEVKPGNDPFVVPSFETISFSLPTVKAWEDFIAGVEDGWCYISDTNPSLTALETLLAKTQGQEACWVTSTGKSAIASWDGAMSLSVCRISMRASVASVDGGRFLE